MWSPLEHSASSVAAMALIPAWRAMDGGLVVRHDWPTRFTAAAAGESYSYAKPCKAAEPPNVTKL